MTALAFRRGAGGLLAATLVIAPLNYGSTRSASLWLLVALLGASALCWVVSLRLEHRIPHGPDAFWLGLALLALAVLPWALHVFHPTLQDPFTREHFAKVVARWPHSVVARDRALMIAFHAALGLAIALVADLARERLWLVTFSAALVLAAVLVSMLACLENLTAASGIYWPEADRMPGRFWGPFFHHTAGGAYLNTAWPLAAGLAVFLRQIGRTTWSLVAVCATVLLLGAHTTHVSRFPQLAALVVLPLLLLRLNLRPRFTRLVLPALAGIVVIALVAGRTGEIARRWRLFESAPSAVVARRAPPEAQWPALVRADLLIPNQYASGMTRDRGEAQRTALRAIAARPFTGHGPQGWTGAASRWSIDPYVRTFYLYLQFVHEDFLQAWVEWGVAGFTSLLLLLPGAVIVGWRSRRADDPAFAPLPVCAAGALGAVLLQSLMDFPLQIPAVAFNASVLAALCWSAFVPEVRGQKSEISPSTQAA